MGRALRIACAKVFEGVSARIDISSLSSTAAVDSDHTEHAASAFNGKHGGLKTRKKTGIRPNLMEAQPRRIHCPRGAGDIALQTRCASCICAEDS